MELGEVQTSDQLVLFKEEAHKHSVRCSTRLLLRPVVRMWEAQHYAMDPRS